MTSAALALEAHRRQQDLSLAIGSAHDDHVRCATRHHRSEGVVLERRCDIANPNRSDEICNDARNHEPGPGRGPHHDGAEIGQGRSGARATTTTRRVEKLKEQPVLAASADEHTPIIVRQSKTDR